MGLVDTKMRLAPLVAAALVAGCQSQPIEEMSYSEYRALFGELHKRCAQQGFPDNHPESRFCIQQELNREVATRHNNAEARQRFAAGMAAAGAQMQASAMHQQTLSAINRPVNCTSTPGMNGVIRTNCY